MFFDVLKLEEKLGLTFWRVNDTERGMSNVFSGYKQPSKLFLVFRA